MIKLHSFENRIRTMSRQGCLLIWKKCKHNVFCINFNFLILGVGLFKSSFVVIGSWIPLVSVISLIYNRCSAFLKINDKKRKNWYASEYILYHIYISRKVSTYWKVSICINMPATYYSVFSCANKFEMEIKFDAV